MIFIPFLIISCTSNEKKKVNPEATIHTQPKVIDFEQLNIDTIPLVIPYEKTCEKSERKKFER